MSVHNVNRTVTTVSYYEIQKKKIILKGTYRMSSDAYGIHITIAKHITKQS